GESALQKLVSTAHVRELERVEESADALVIGAAVTYTEALPSLERLLPSFAAIVRRIGSRQIRALGTFGGNLATASPIGDTLPCLMALGATVTVQSSRGERALALED